MRERLQFCRLLICNCAYTVNQPGVQIYDARHRQRSHLAIEPQGWPNAVNQTELLAIQQPF